MAVINVMKRIITTEKIAKKTGDDVKSLSLSKTCPPEVPNGTSKF